MLECSSLEDRQQLIQIDDQEVRGLLELDCERGVEHIRAGHSLVQPAPLRPQFVARPC